MREGRLFRIPSIPFRAKRFRKAGLFSVNPFFFSSSERVGGTMSSIRQGIPALARCAAIPEPITPAPRTATLRIFGNIGSYLLSGRCRTERETESWFILNSLSRFVGCGQGTHLYEVGFTPGMS